MFINSTTNKCYFEGNKIKNEKLSQTLEQLANSGNPLQLFYNGVISESIVDDINEASKEWNTTCEL
jgi:gamma-glutamyltranspeptidase